MPVIDGPRQASKKGRDARTPGASSHERTFVMHPRSLALSSLFVAVALSGCNPSGTCIQDDPNGGFYPTCRLDTPRRACESSGHGEFFEESRAAGLLRCRGLGFETRPGGGEDLLFRAR